MKNPDVYLCDVCQDRITDIKLLRRKIQVIFTTEQTEGYSCEPHLCDETLDICKDCFEKVLHGNYIFGSGGMGYNKYAFKNKMI